VEWNFQDFLDFFRFFSAKPNFDVFHRISGFHRFFVLFPNVIAIPGLVPVSIASAGFYRIFSEAFSTWDSKTPKRLPVPLVKRLNFCIEVNDDSFEQC
jgi:hypothetical protein